MLRLLPDELLATLPEETRAEIRRRLGAEFHQFRDELIAQRRRFPGASGDLNALILDVSLACKAIARRVAYGALSDVVGATGERNVQGEEQLALDVLSLAVDADLRSAGACTGVTATWHRGRGRGGGRRAARRLLIILGTAGQAGGHNCGASDRDNQTTFHTCAPL